MLKPTKESLQEKRQHHLDQRLCSILSKKKNIYIYIYKYIYMGVKGVLFLALTLGLERTQLLFFDTSTNKSKKNNNILKMYNNTINSTLIC